jgi:D-tyrosyl-tRNA(Tyr) deacylase
MRVVLQRVTEASVLVEGGVVGEIGPGLVLLVGISGKESRDDLVWLAEKCVHLRVFPDDAGKMNRSLADFGGEILAVSQFTLYGDCRKGRRPSFTAAAPSDLASGVFDDFLDALRDQGVKVETGIFGEMMEVHLVNDGPVTLILER